MKIPESKIAVTLFNLRNFCKTESDLDSTLDKVAAMGYQCVQVSGVPLAADVIRRQLDKHALYCCATHESLDALKGESAPLIDKLQTLNCTYTALGGPGAMDITEPDVVRELAAIFNRQSEALAAAGITLGYHNHFGEFSRVKGMKKVMLEYFMELVDARVASELDIHWVTRGGGSPATWIKKFAGRIPVIHFKDFAIIGGEPCFCEIGEGNLDWPEILAACEKSGVRWYSIEQDKEIPGRSIFDSIRISIDNLHAMGVR